MELVDHGLVDRVENLWAIHACYNAVFAFGDLKGREARCVEAHGLDGLHDDRLPLAYADAQGC